MSAINVRDFSAVGDGTANDSDAFDRAIRQAVASGKALYIPNGVYLINVTVPGALRVFGDGNRYSVLRWFSPNKPIIEYRHVPIGYWNYETSFTDIGFESPPDAAFRGDGFCFSPLDPAADDPQFGNFTRMGNVSFQRCRWRHLNRGVVKPWGTLGNQYVHCTWMDNNFHVFWIGSDDFGPAGRQHSGCEYVIGGQMTTARVAAVYISDSYKFGGAWVFRDTIIQQNHGFDFFVSRRESPDGPLLGTSRYIPGIVLDCIWLEVINEDDRRRQPIALPGGRTEPVADIFLEGVTMTCRNVTLSEITLRGAALSATDCVSRFASGFPTVDSDVESSVAWILNGVPQDLPPGP